MPDEGVFVGANADEMAAEVDRAVSSMESEQQEEQDSQESQPEESSAPQRARDASGRFLPNEPAETADSGDDGLSAADVELAKAYGLKAEEFSTSADLEARVGEIDRQLVASQQQPQQQQPLPPPQPPQQQQQPQQWQQPEFKYKFGEGFDPADAKVLNEGLNEVGTYATQLVQQAVTPLVQMVYQQQQVLAQLQQQAASEVNQRVHQEFDEAVNNLGNSSLFGKGDFNSASRAQQAMRQRLYQQATALASGMAQQGIQVPPLDDLVTRVYRMEWPDAVQAETRQQVTSRIRSRGSSKTPASGGTNQRGRSDHDQWDGEPENDPVLRERFKQYELENEQNGRR